MTTATAAPPTQREPELLGQTVVVIGGSAGIGLDTARRARAEGADIILVGRNPQRLEHAAGEVGARGTATFDANDMAALEDEGYIAQPHTSAGRIPTDKGYRLFVDKLAGVKPMTAP